MRLGVLVAAVGLVGTGCTTGLSLTLTAAAEELPPDIGEAVAVDAAAATTSSTSTSSTTSSTTTTEPPPPSIVLGFAGDVNMIRGIEASRPLDAVTDLLSAPDVMMVNLETVVGEPDEVGTPPIPKEFIFRSPPETLDQLAEAGVDVVGLANNHSWDYGPRGVIATAEHVAASELAGAGVGPDRDAAHAPVFVAVGETTVGVVSLTLVPCDWTADPAAERPEIAYACDRFAVPTFGTISDVLAGSDISVILVHASEELADCPPDWTHDIVTAWLDFGIDVVAVSHPHVLGGIERIGDGVVLWSTGNFAFVNGGGRTARSAVFEVAFEGSDVSDVRIHPTVLPGGVAAPATAEIADLVRAEISERSPGAAIDGSGRWVPDSSASICDRP